VWNYIRLRSGFFLCVTVGDRAVLGALEISLTHREAEPYNRGNIGNRGDRLLFASFQAGQVGMLDVTDREHPVQSGIVSAAARHRVQVAIMEEEITSYRIR
jgi:hypothetical protein